MPARLIDVATPPQPAGVVLVLHGGASRGAGVQVSPAQLSVLRMIPVARRIAHAGRRRVAVLRLLNSLRGWDSGHTPVQDVGWALGEVARRFGADVPVCLVGHSLGGRAALLSAGERQVHGVVALAPWIGAGDAPAGEAGAADEADEAGTPIVIIHGDEDQVASPDRSRELARSLARQRRGQTRVAYVTVRGGSHAMLSRRGQFDGLAAQCAIWMLLGVRDDLTVRRIAEGESELTVGEPRSRRA